MVFDKEVNPLLQQQIHQVTKGSDRYKLQQVADKIQQSYPGGYIEAISIPSQPEKSYHVLFNSPEKVKTDIYINPYNGKLLGVYPRDKVFMPVVRKLHENLLLGKAGRYIVGISGLSLLILSITGLFLWNGWKRLAASLKIRRSAKFRIFNYSWYLIKKLILRFIYKQIKSHPQEKK